MPRDNTRRALLSTWFTKSTGELAETDYLVPQQAPTRTPDAHESIFAPSPLVPADRMSGALMTRDLHVAEEDAGGSIARKGRVRRLLPLALVPALVVLLAAGWAMLSTPGLTPPSTSVSPNLRPSAQGTDGPASPAQPTATHNRQTPAMAGAGSARTRTPARTSTPTKVRSTNTPVPEPTGTPTPAATATPLPTNTALPTDTPLPTNTPEPPTATPVPPTNTPQPFVRYVVRPGDNLTNIANRFGTTVDAIVRANGLAGTTIFVGQSLVIPVAR